MCVRSKRWFTLKTPNLVIYFIAQSPKLVFPAEPRTRNAGQRQGCLSAIVSIAACIDAAICLPTHRRRPGLVYCIVDIFCSSYLIFFSDFSEKVDHLSPIIFGEKKERKKKTDVRPLDGHVEHVCKISGSTSQKTAWTWIRLFFQTTWF